MTVGEVVLVSLVCGLGPCVLAFGVAAVIDWIDRRRR